MVEIAVKSCDDIIRETMSSSSCPCTAHCSSVQNKTYTQTDIIPLLQRIERLEKHCYGLKEFNETNRETTPLLVRVDSISQPRDNFHNYTMDSSELLLDENIVEIPESNVAVIKQESEDITVYESPQPDNIYESNGDVCRKNTQKRTIEDVRNITEENETDQIAKRPCFEVVVNSSEVNFETDADDETGTKNSINKMQCSLDKLKKLLMTGLKKIDRRFDFVENKLSSTNIHQSLTDIGEEGDDQKKVILWPGTSIDKLKYITLKVKRHRLTDFTNTLLRMVYPRETLASCSVAGKGSNAHKFKPIKPQLPKVESVIDFIQKETCADRKDVKTAVVMLLCTESRRKRVDQQIPHIVYERETYRGGALESPAKNAPCGLNMTD